MQSHARTYTCTHIHTYIHTQPLDFSLSPGSRGVSLDQHVAETESYYHLLHEQVANITKAMKSSSEEAAQLKETAKNLLEALRQSIHLVKESRMIDTTSGGDGGGSVDPSPGPEGEGEDEVLTAVVNKKSDKDEGIDRQVETSR